MYAMLCYAMQMDVMPTKTHIHTYTHTGIGPDKAVVAVLQQQCLEND